MEELLPHAKGTGMSALRRFGALHQIDKCIEELLELVLELGKHKAGSKNTEAIIDEVADVWLTTIQMALLFGWENCERRFQFKIDRLDSLMNPQSMNAKFTGTPIMGPTSAFSSLGTE